MTKRRVTLSSSLISCSTDLGLTHIDKFICFCPESPLIPKLELGSLSHNPALCSNLAESFTLSF